MIRDIALHEDIGLDELTRLCNLALDLLCVASFDGHFKLLNPAWETVLGWTREDLTSSPFMKFVHPDDIARTEEAFQHLLSGQELRPIHGFANRYRCRNGGYRWLAWSCAVDTARRLIYCTAHDITDQRRENEELQQMRQRLEQLALVDALTGLFNRRGGTEALEREMSRARRFHNQLCVAIIDVDHFKAVNDVFGHPAGDAALASIAATLRNEARGADIVARWGGEEFLAILPNVGIDGALVFAERTRKQIEDQTHGKAGKLTISVGVAEFAQGDAATSLTSRADAHLYNAKIHGRNRVSAAAEPVVLKEIK